MNDIKNLISKIYSPVSPDFLTNDSEAIEKLMIYFKIPEDVFELELLFTKLSFIAEINWDNYVIIARALNYNYPDVDLLNISDEEIRQNTINLPNFIDSKYPKDSDYYTAIFTSWSILRENLP